jgi:asparagine N-glycosylation enzyme membrane subunit Stt3
MQIDEYIEDEKSYDYYYNKVAEYKQDQTITQYEREDLSKEITKCNNISKKQKETLIQSLKN